MNFASVYAAARYYRDTLKWSVAPVVPKGKFPALDSWKELQTRLPTDKELELCRKPGIGVGLVTGSLSRVAVVDLDGSEGVKSASSLGLTSPLMAASGGSGRHLFFQMASGLGNSVRSYPGLDVRADGGFLVLAPSIHASGRPYRWLNFAPNNLPAFPGVLLNAGNPGETKAGDSPARFLGNEPGWIAEALKDMQIGNIDNTLFRVCSRLRNDGYTQADVLTLLTPHAAGAGATATHLADKIAHVWSTYEAKKLYSFAAPVAAMSGSQLLASTVTTSWLVDNLIPENGITFVVGMQGIGKTWLALDLAVGLAAQEPKWLGQFPSKTGGKVLYMDEESSVALLSDRIKLVAKDRRVDLDKLSFLVKQGLDVLNPSDLEVFKTHIQSSGATVVILDSYSCFHSGDDNSTDHTLKVMKVLKTICHDLKVTLVVVDHMATHAVYRQANDSTPVSSNDIAGSKMKARQCDSMLTFMKRDATITCHHVKSRYTETTRPFSLELVAGEKSLRPVVTLI